MLADYIVLESTDVVPIPDGMTYEEASTLRTAAVTAWNAVEGRHELHAKDIEKIFTLDEYEAALKLMATGQFAGKIVLTLQ